MPKVVFDTNIFLRSLINPHGIYARLISASDKFKLFFSEEIITEILDVLYRSALRKKYPQIKKIDIQGVFNALSDTETIRPTEKINICRDSEDNKFLECAVSAKADYLVSADNDLLDLKEYHGIKIVSARDFLRALGLY